MKTSARIVTGGAALTLAAAALLAPATAQAAPLAAETSEGVCQVTGGVLTWGVKESFRSYISGIAAGGWEPSGGASYSTPSFTWTDPTGEIDPVTGEGRASFEGAVRFTGHDGVLDLTIANPTIELNGDGTARLLLDTKSNDVEGEVEIDELQAYLGKIEGIGELDLAGGATGFVDAPAILTAGGAAAFGGFYSSGDELDPVSLKLVLDGCEAASAEGSDENGEAAADAISATPESAVPWLPIIVGGVAIVVIGVTAGMLIAGRRKNGEQ